MGWLLFVVWTSPNGGGMIHIKFKVLNSDEKSVASWNISSREEKNEDVRHLTFWKTSWDKRKSKF